MKHALFAIVFLGLSLRFCVAEPPAAEILNVARISDRAPHSAFTDLIRWKDQFVCAFREGRAHVSADGKIRVLSSTNGDEWKPAAILELAGYDLRDAGLSIAPDGRLMLIGGACPRPNDTDSAPTGTFVAFSEDAKEWTKPQVVTEPGNWLWRITWQDGKAYGVAYGNGPGPSSLLVSDDGVKYSEHVAKLLDAGWPTEATIRFDGDGTAFCLHRRDGKAPENTAMLGVSKPPYKNWEWHDLDMYFGGPNFIKLPSGRYVASGRIIENGKPSTVVARLDVEKKRLEPIATLPSGGDTSYPGLVWYDGVLWVSYYSSHEDKTSIYLAKVKLDGESAADAANSKVSLSANQIAAAENRRLDKDAIESLIDKPLYEFTETEVDAYLIFLSAAEPDLRKRIVHLARKNIDQPYELYLLGEAPYETHDPQPIYCLGKSDCVVFSEHTYAMALSDNWPSFIKMLQRIRYRDGKLSVVTRNHYTEADWNISNRWLVEDITRELAGDKAVTFRQAIDRAKFFKKRYKLDVDVPVEQHTDVFIPFEAIDQAKAQLQDGDFVNIVRGTVSKDAPASELSDTFGGSAWVGHVGMIAHGDDGEVHLIHSTQPKVREEPIDQYIARSTKTMKEDDAKGKARLLGFKFLRLRDDPMKHLREIDGDDAPKVTLPGGETAEF